MPELTQEQRDKIIGRLMERKAVLPCPRCGNKNFVLLDGYFIQPISTDIGAVVIGGQSIPSVVTACAQCGFLSQHALGALGLLPAETESK
jgi:predicted RNA-binding Zn-ribbon protein involved in translation (DUF1610 family)